MGRIFGKIIVLRIIVIQIKIARKGNRDHLIFHVHLLL